MSALEIPELNTRFFFRERPEAIPGDLRPIWRIGLVLLILHISSRSGKSSFGRLHVMNWALRSEEGRNILLGILKGQRSPETMIVRIEPSLNRAVDYANGEGLVQQVQGSRIELTGLGKEEAKNILKCEGIYKDEREFLYGVGKKVTEQRVTELFGGQA